MDQYIGGISEIITTLNRRKQVGKINSPMVVKMALSKLLTPWRNMWGEEVTAGRQEMSLASLREWLDRKLTGQEIGQAAGFTYMEERPDVDTRGREAWGWETPRRIYNVAVRSTVACAICRGIIQEFANFSKGKSCQEQWVGERT